MDTSSKALIDHWPWAAKRGLMNDNTAKTLRAACAKVLGIFDDLGAVDVRQLDVEDTLRRFKNLRGKDLKPDSIEAYEQRFRQAVKSFLDYVNDPGAWKFTTRPPVRNGHSTPKESAKVKSAVVLAEANGRALDFPFPLLDGFVAHLILPRDLKAADVPRMTMFMNTLVTGDTARPAA